MNISTLLPLLRFARIILLVFFVTGCGLSLLLLSQAVDAANKPEVRLTLDTTHPAHFAFWHGVNDGFERGKRHESLADKGWEHLPPLQLATGQQFELTANPAARLLRYQEPNLWRRVALLALGALPGDMSVAGIFFWVCGSWLLLKILQDVTPETPFTYANARRLRNLAVLVVGLNLWSYVAQVGVLTLVPAFRLAGVGNALNQYVHLNTEALLPGFEMGLILIIIAAVYQRGVVLSQDAELVI